jgi:hypothetical protein
MIRWLSFVVVLGTACSTNSEEKPESTSTSPTLDFNIVPPTVDTAWPDVEGTDTDSDTDVAETDVDETDDDESDTEVDTGDPDTGADLDGTAEFAVLFASTGSGTAIDLGDVPIPTDFTLEAWVYPTTSTELKVIFSKEVGGVAANQFRLTLDSLVPSFFMANASEEDLGLSLTGPSAIASAAWTHLAVTKNGNDFVLYVNGASVATSTTTGALVHSARRRRSRSALRWGHRRSALLGFRAYGVRYRRQPLREHSFHEPQVQPSGGVLAAR